MNKKYGKVAIKKIKSDLDNIPNDCGYQKQFEHNIDMNSNGVMADCIEWCQSNCEGKWGWWFKPAVVTLTEYPTNHWEDQNAYMSFERKRDATRFWMAVGIQNSGNKLG